MNAPCPFCGRPMSDYQVKKGYGSCSRSCAARLRGRPESERFLSRIAFGADEECWPWLGELNGHGYGRFATYYGQRRRHLAHRYMLEMDGVDLEGRVVMHTCDNPPCVNPAHLRVGTQLDNIRDAISKGRMDMSGLEIGWRLKRGEVA